MKLDSIAKKFVSNDSLRPAMMQVSGKDGFVYATNAHILLKAPADRFEQVYPAVEKYPNCDAVIPAFDKPLFSFSAKEVMERYKAAPKIDEHEDCPKCNGEGEIECDCCGFTNDCEDCNGDGHTDKVIGKIVDANGALLKVGKAAFDMEYMKIICQVAAALDEDEIMCMSQRSDESLTFLMIQDVIICIMPRKVNCDAKIYKVECSGNAVAQ